LNFQFNFLILLQNLVGLDSFLISWVNFDNSFLFLENYPFHPYFQQRSLLSPGTGGSHLGLPSYLGSWDWEVQVLQFKASPGK
jgi:hypothetical protein